MENITTKRLRQHGYDGRCIGSYKSIFYMRPRTPDLCEGIARIIEIQSPQIRGVKGEHMEIKGIDVSSWQGKPDWAKVSNSGIKLAILRIHQKSGTGD